jgi:hypothetical protein
MKYKITYTFECKEWAHRVDRVPGFLSSRPNWLPLPPHPQGNVAPHFGSKGGTHLLAREGAVGANSDAGTGKIHLQMIPMGTQI